MPLPSSAGGFAKHGKFYTSSTVTDATKVKTLITAIQKAFAEPGAKKEMVWILSGTHGTATGELVKEKKFFFEDKALEGSLYKSVNVYGFTADDGHIVKSRWDTYTGKTGVVILAWCFSEQARTGWMKTAKLAGV
jgi:hypothetical protein